MRMSKCLICWKEMTDITWQKKYCSKCRKIRDDELWKKNRANKKKK